MSGEIAMSHDALLPATLRARIAHREKLALSFVLAFLEANQLPAQLLVNGGYVRDLLLGKTPDDLDVSLCLRDCPPEVSINTIIAAMPEFALSRPDLAVSNVHITTILSDTSKDKNVDTAKAYFRIGDPSATLEIDFMPTIGEEQYDDTDRVPLRDVRGTPEQDALRRDLTIGALLLHVTHGDDGGGGGREASAAEAEVEAAAAAALVAVTRWRWRFRPRRLRPRTRWWFRPWARASRRSGLSEAATTKPR